ncbi:MAG: tail fiber domain-containing protein [Bacteroidota bacterium]
MKKMNMVAVILSCIMFLMTGMVNAQWTFSAPDEYITSGKVGIGTSTPTFLLHVQNGSYDGNEGWGTCNGGSNTLPASSIGTLSVSSTDDNGNIGIAGIASDDDGSNIGGYFHGNSNWVDNQKCQGAMGAYGFATGDGLSSAEADWALCAGIHGEASGSNTMRVGGNFWVENHDCTGSSAGIVTGASGGSKYIIGIYADAYNDDDCEITEEVATSGGNQPAVLAAYFGGNTFTTGSAWMPSDERLKQNVKDVKNASALLSNLPVKTYTFNREKFPSVQFAKGLHYGIMAQDVEKVLPTLVLNTRTVSPTRKGVTNPTYDIKAINYNEFIPLLIGAHNELKAELKQKSNDLDDLKKQVAEMKELLIEICNNGCEGLQGSLPAKPNSGGILYQSIPNPTSGSATINYNITTSFNSALITISTIDGKMVREYPITHQGAGSIVFEKNDRSDNAFKYSLIVDGKVYDTKSIVITRN